MTPEEAIRIIETMQDIEGAPFTPLGKQALALGIQALKRCRNNYLNPQRADFRRLPGETVE